MTLAALADYLHPVISAASLEKIIRELPGLNPVGYAPSTGGRRARTYDAGDVQELHNCLRRWL